MFSQPGGGTARKLNKQAFENARFYVFLRLFLKNLRKKIDFFRKKYYTVSKWSKMEEKWSKMEEVSRDDR